MHRPTGEASRFVAPDGNRTQFGITPNRMDLRFSTYKRDIPIVNVSRMRDKIRLGCLSRSYQGFVHRSPHRSRGFVQRSSFRNFIVHKTVVFWTSGAYPSHGGLTVSLNRHISV